MKEIVVKIEDVESATKQIEESSYKIICSSNIGLNKGLVRLTIVSKNLITDTLNNE